MRYNVPCPHCGKPRSLPDYGLWPDDGHHEYPGPTEPQQCLDCQQWMRVVLVGDAVTVEKFAPRMVYDDCPCSCNAACPSNCTGECGCSAHHAIYQDYLSSPMASI